MDRELEQGFSEKENKVLKFYRNIRESRKRKVLMRVYVKERGKGE